MDNDNSGGGFVPLSGLWKSKEKGFLSGKIGRAVYYVFVNEHKRTETVPDYQLCIAKARGEERETLAASKEPEF